MILSRFVSNNILNKNIITSYIFAVDFNNILEQACLRETALGEMLQLCEHRCGQKVKLEARVQIIEV